MKRYFTHDFSSFYSDTFPLILVFYAAFFEEYNCFLHFKSFSATDLLILSLFTVVTFGWAFIGDGSIPILSIDTIGHAGYR
jgi:hypothetical protein